MKGYVVVMVVAIGATACGGAPESAAPPATPAPVTNPVDPATAGTVSGKITLAGAAPKPAALRMDSDPNCKTDGPPPAEEGLVVGEGGAIKNVFVYVKDGLGNLGFPVPSTPVVLDQKGCHYIPHVFGVQAGQGVDVLNSDPTLHNVHAVPKANQEFNTGQPLAGMRHTHTFSTREVMIPFKCDVHPWMHAYVGVLDHPFFAVTGADGTFTIKGLPPGTYTIEAWQEKLGAQTQTVTLGASETKDVAFSYKLTT
jgi:plastocyanin